MGTLDELKAEVERLSSITNSQTRFIEKIHETINVLENSKKIESFSNAQILEEFERRFDVKININLRINHGKRLV